MITSATSPVAYDRIHAEQLVEASSSWIRVKPLYARILLPVASAVLIFGALRAVHLWPTVSFPIAALCGVAMLVWLSGDTFASLIQEALHRLKGVPKTRRVWPGHGWIRVEDMRAGAWLCLRREHETEARELRKVRGRQSGDPKMTCKLAVAFIKVNGNKLQVAFSDGTASTWRPQADMCMFAPRRRWRQPTPELSQIFTQSGSLLDEMVGRVYQHGNRPMPLVDLFPGRQSVLSSQEFKLAFAAAKKWKLVEEVAQGESIGLTTTGTVWFEATATSQNSSGPKRNQSSGGRTSVTNNYHIHGPSNWVQGTNHGTMNANNQNAAVTPADLMAALQAVLSINSIPWDQGELVQVRRTLCQAVAKNEPSYARNAVRKLGQIVEQLALGVGSNAAYQLLITHLK